jgi:hypothetical protein
MHQEACDLTFDRLQQEVQAYDSSFVLPHRSDVLTASEIRPHLNTATRTLTKCQRDAIDVRFRSYYDLVTLYASDTNPDTRKKESARKAKAVRKPITSENRRALFSHIRSILKPCCWRLGQDYYSPMDTIPCHTD